MVEPLCYSNYPQVDPAFINENHRRRVGMAQTAIIALRTIRSEMSISPAITNPLYLRTAPLVYKSVLKSINRFLKFLGKITQNSLFTI